MHLILAKWCQATAVETIAATHCQAAWPALASARAPMRHTLRVCMRLLLGRRSFGHNNGLDAYARPIIVLHAAVPCSVRVAMPMRVCVKEIYTVDAGLQLP